MTIIATVEFIDGDDPVELRGYSKREIMEGCACWIFTENRKFKEAVIYPLHRIKSIVIEVEKP